MLKKMFKALFVQPKYNDRILHYTIILLGIFGIVMQVSASMFTSTDYSSWSLIMLTIKQIAYFVAGFLAMNLVANYFSFELAKKIIIYLMITTIILLLITRLFGSVGGSYGWIKMTVFNQQVTIQPSEFAKLIMIVVMALYLGDKKEGKWYKLIMIPFIFFLVSASIIAFYQNDMGSAMVFVLITFFCFIIPTNKSLLPTQMVALILGALFIYSLYYLTTPSGLQLLEKLNISDYQLTRFRAVQFPFYDKFAKGYFDLNNSLIGFSRGDLFGVGLGKSILKYSNISAAPTDFIMEVIVEELGFMGFLYVLVGYLALSYRLILHAIKINGEKIKIVMMGVMMYFVLHFIFNIGGVTCLLPLTGIPLLLISAGGSSTLSAMMAIGFAQALISKNAEDRIKRRSIYEDNSR